VDFWEQTGVVLFLRSTSGPALDYRVSISGPALCCKVKIPETKMEVVLVQRSISGPALYYKVWISDNQHRGCPSPEVNLWTSCVQISALYYKVWISEKQTMLD